MRNCSETDCGGKSRSVRSRTGYDPHLSGLEWVEGVYPTSYGDIQVEMNQKGKKIIAPKEITVIE